MSHFITFCKLKKNFDAKANGFETEINKSNSKTKSISKISNFSLFFSFVNKTFIDIQSEKSAHKNELHPLDLLTDLSMHIHSCFRNMQGLPKLFERDLSEKPFCFNTITRCFEGTQLYDDILINSDTPFLPEDLFLVDNKFIQINSPNTFVNDAINNFATHHLTHLKSITGSLLTTTQPSEDMNGFIEKQEQHMTDYTGIEHPEIYFEYRFLDYCKIINSSQNGTTYYSPLLESNHVEHTSTSVELPSEVQDLWEEIKNESESLPDQSSKNTPTDPSTSQLSSDETDDPTDPSTSQSSSVGPTDPSTSQSSSVGPTEPSSQSSSYGSTETPSKSSYVGPTEPSSQTSSDGSTETPSKSSSVGPTEPSSQTSSDGSTDPSYQPSSVGPTEPSSKSSSVGPTEPSSQSSSYGSTETPSKSSYVGPTEPSSQTSSDGSTETPSKSSSVGPTEPSSQTSSDGSTDPSYQPSSVGPTEPSSKSSSVGPTEPSSQPSSDGSTETPSIKRNLLNEFNDPSSSTSRPSYGGKSGGVITLETNDIGRIRELYCIKLARLLIYMWLFKRYGSNISYTTILSELIFSMSLGMCFCTQIELILIDTVLSTLCILAYINYSCRHNYNKLNSNVLLVLMLIPYYSFFM